MTKKDRANRQTDRASVPAVVDARKNLPAVSRGLIAGAGNDITIPFFSGVLAHADDTLIQRGGGKGLKIYDEIERDTHAYAVLQKRKKALLAREWQVEPASDAEADVAAAEVVRSCLTGLPFDRICEDLLDATLKGFAISEIIWARDGALVRPIEVVAHDQRRFVFDADWRPRLLTWHSMVEGEQLPDRKFIVHRFGVKGNNPYGLGMGTRLFWPVLFKREGVAFWLHYLEKYASPTVIGYTPYSGDAAQDQRFLNMLRNLRSNSAATAPIGVDIKLLEAARGGSASYEDFLGYWDSQISISVLGETLTTDVGDAGSRAAAETHEGVLQQLVDADADLLSDTLNATLARWIIDYNCPGAGVPQIWRVRAENETDAARSVEAKATAASASSAALAKVLAIAAKMADDGAARAFIGSFGLTTGFSDDTVNELVAIRHAFADSAVPPAPPARPFLPAAFAAGSKKN